MRRIATSRRIALALIAAVAATVAGPGPSNVARAADAAATPTTTGEVVPAKPQQWLYVLRLVPRLHDDKAWTDADNAAIGRHFQHLKNATAAGKVVLAGRTTEPGDRTFGLVIFEATSEVEARGFMESDPAVVAGIMQATLHPYAVALQRKP